MRIDVMFIGPRGTENSLSDQIRFISKECLLHHLSNIRRWRYSLIIHRRWGRSWPWSEGNQPTGDKLSDRLLLFSAWPAVTFPAAELHCHFDNYRIILLDDRGTCMWTTCPESLHESGPAGTHTCDLTIASHGVRWPDHHTTTLRLNMPWLKHLSFSNFIQYSHLQSRVQVNICKNIVTAIVLCTTVHSCTQLKFRLV